MDEQNRSVPAIPEDSRPHIPVSVRELVEFVWTRGSIHPGDASTVVDMQMGTAIHRKLQSLAKDGDEGYQAEVRCSVSFGADDLCLDVRGQMDGLSRAGERPRIDEIKSVRVPGHAVDSNERALHWAQAKVYGHILCGQESLERVDLRLIYYEVRTGETTRLDETWSAADLAAFFEDTCRRYAVWQRWKLGHVASRNRTAAALSFPFDFRPGQRTAAGRVYRAIRDGQTMMLQAPTGIGKTLATLFPGVKAQGEGACQTLFYLTAKTSGRAAAVDGLRQLEGVGYDCRAVRLTAKERVCPHELRCNPTDCPLADGYYDRNQDAVMELLTTGTIFTPEILAEVSERRQVCPFELALDVSSWCDVVIGDYNHLIDPVAKLQRFFGGDERTEHAVLLDEAHNLVERGRDAFSAELNRRAVDDAGKLVKEAFPRLKKKLRKLGSPFRAKSKEMKTPEGERLERMESGYPAELVEAASDFCECYLEHLREERFDPYKEQLRELYFAASLLTVVAGFYDEKYTTYWERRGGDMVVRLFCADPSRLLRKSYERCRSAVLFSATLLPETYYAAALSDDPVPRLDVPSPFPKENLLVLFGEPVSTRFKDRAGGYDKVAEYIRRAVGHKTGNYLVFLPSFAYLREIASRLGAEMGETEPPAETAISAPSEVEQSRFGDAAPDESDDDTGGAAVPPVPAPVPSAVVAPPLDLDAPFELMIQQPHMDEQARADFLARFERYGDRTRVGLCVVGGVFAEGVDLAGERLSGAIVVGVGLPTVSFERELIRARLDENGRGYQYAYLYPGLNRVFQAAGRVIRTETDRGFVLLLDDRYLSREYIRQYPPQWANNRVCRSADDLDRALEEHFGTPAKTE